MGTAERREREKLALQQKIIDKGREILVNEGPGALTMRRLADEIEYTAGALYAHFADKEELVRAICQTDFEAFTSQFSSAMAEKDPLKRLRLLAKLYARFALEHPAQYKILFVLDSVGGVEKERGNPEKDAYAIVELAVDAAMREGHFKAFQGRTQLVAQSLWAAMHGVVSIEIRRVDDMQIAFELIDDRVDAMCEIMIAGLDAMEKSPVAKASAVAGVKKQAPARKAPVRAVPTRRPAAGRKHT